MALPSPLPDNPTRWDGWKNYNSANFYARLCLSYESRPTAEQIEDNCRQLLVWWQKKLPLKNHTSNPVAQMLRGGLDEAPKYLAEARTVLLNEGARAQIDADLHGRIVQEALDELNKLLTFSLSENQLKQEDEDRLGEHGRLLGLAPDEIKKAIETELTRLGATRYVAAPPPPVEPPLAVRAVADDMRPSADPSDEFRRMLRMSKLCLEGDDMTDDQRDALCNMGESLGLTGGQAEDLIDEYLEAVEGMPLAAAKPLVATMRSAGTASAVAAMPPKRAESLPPKGAPTKLPTAIVPKPAPVVTASPLARAQERQNNPPFQNSAGIEMLLVPRGAFNMGSTAPDAAAHEQPVTRVTLSGFYMARFPVTNAQYEVYDSAHSAKRAPWGTDVHPVVYVTSRDAEKFCTWLSMKEGRKYRLPTEAEWEFAARGGDNRAFPWGEALNAGNLANFADRQTRFAWREPEIDDGYAETAPVGSYPRGASPFGIEDLSGNVFEWCFDFFEPYKGKERNNPRGPSSGPKRIYRGGSWKSRASNLRAAARNFNLPDYSSNDVGFRIVCECET